MDLNDGMPYHFLLGGSDANDEKLKFSSIFAPDLKKATKSLATQFFTHVNPYTGKALANDPGVAMFELINECSMLSNWGKPLQEALSEPYLTEIKDLWSAWLKKNGIESRPLPNNFSVDAVARRFGTEMEAQYLEEMSAHLRSLGVKAPICGTNITFTLGDLKASEKMDYMAEHSYWAHPGVQSRPMTYSDAPALARPIWQLPVISDLAKGAMKGYPLVNGEWNYCFPNSARCEGIPMAAAYASYQDWNGMIFYCATGSFDGGNWARFEKTPGILVHSQQTDPATWGLSQVGAAMFRRGDVASSARTLEALLPESAIDENVMAIKKMPFLPALGRYQIAFSGPDGKANWLGELAQSQLSGKDIYLKVLEKIGDKESDINHVVSDTRQIRRHSSPALLFVDTPKTQSVSGRLCDIGKSGDVLGNVKVDSPMTWGSLSVVAIDGQDIASSQRLLLVAAANASNKDTKCDPDAGLLLNMGKESVMAEPFDAKVTLSNSSKSPKVYVLDPLTGARVKELPLVREQGKLSFSIDSACKSIYFEIVSE